MNPRLLLFALFAAATACQRESDIQPNAQTLAGEVVGTYRTNVYLDPSGVALSAGQMPYVELQAESDSTVTLIYKERFPDTSSLQVLNVIVKRQANVIQLRQAGLTIGSFQTDRIFLNNGMEKQGKLLRISLQNHLDFAGFK
jgi:hypothetical protein